MKSNNRLMTTTVAGLAAIATLFATAAQARTPETAAEKVDHDKAYYAVVKMGDDLWHGGAPSTNGLACGNCHPDAAAIQPNTFPKFQLDMGAVVPLRDMINWCIAVPLAGEMLDPNGDKMKAMEAFAFVMSRGFAIKPNDNSAQHGPVIVKNGLGFPTDEDRGYFPDTFKKSNPFVKRPAYTN